MRGKLWTWVSNITLSILPIICLRCFFKFDWNFTISARRKCFSGLPLSVQDIIQLPMDEFNDLLSKHELTEEQLSLCRDIRRRGKNKASFYKNKKINETLIDFLILQVAARNCRRRKIDQIKQLEDDVTR